MTTIVCSAIPVNDNQTRSKTPESSVILAHFRAFSKNDHFRLAAGAEAQTPCYRYVFIGSPGAGTNFMPLQNELSPIKGYGHFETRRRRQPAGGGR
jgi:hypothetical protein